MKPTLLALVVAVSAALTVPATASAQIFKRNKKTTSKDAPAEWNQWRGPNRDGKSPDTGLLKEWPSGGPPLAWKATGIGEGLSSVSVFGGRIFTMGEFDGESYLLALNAEDGKIVWKTKVGKGGGSDQGGKGPRSTPATDGKLVWALGQEGELICVRAADGRQVWATHYDKLGGSRPGWWHSESPLLDGNYLIIKPGKGSTSVVGLQKTSGKLAWKSPSVQGNPHYTSVTIAQIGRIKQYLLFTEKTIAGIYNGKVAWQVPFPGQTAVVPDPVYANGIVFVCSGYDVGCKAVQIAAGNRPIAGKEIYSGKQMVNHTGGVVAVGEHLYGTDYSALKCIELKTGKVVWEERSVGKGSTTYADGHLYVRGERGDIALVEATPEGYKEKGRFSQPDRSSVTAWAHPVVIGGKMYIRDEDVLLCYDVKAK